MFGVVVDVSGSMRNAYALEDDGLHRDDVSMERTHAVFTTIANIVEREVTHHDRHESIFACAFGLQRPAPICNLIELFAKLRELNEIQRRTVCVSQEREKLVELAMQHDGAHAEEWIRHHLKDKEVVLLNWLLREDESLIPKLLEKIPSTFAVNAVRLKCKTQDTAEDAAKAVADGAKMMANGAKKVATTTVTSLLNPVGAAQRFYGWFTSPPRMPSPPPPPPPPKPTRWDHTVEDSEAYEYARAIMSDKSLAFTKTLLKPIELRSVQYVSKLMKDLDAASGSSSMSRQNQIQGLIDEIKPFIYGKTPMCYAMNGALDIFRQASVNTAKVLFILSDGRATDGDPLPIAKKLRTLGVYIVTCYLTSDNIDNSKRLFYEANSDWEKGRLDLFKMSSTMKNTHTPVSYLVDAGWELPPSGESRLFVQANSLKVVNELCEIVVSRMTEGCDALVDALGKVDLATYINQANAGFIPRDQQQEATCYAHAIAATFHLAMHRIVGREGGIPSFETILDRIVEEYGKEGANTVKVLQAVCPEYRLQFKEVDETGARQAINQRRPVVARFRLYPKQWNKFENFFSKTAKGILKETDLQTCEF